MTATRRPGFFLHVVPALLYVGAVFLGGSAHRDPTALIHFSAKDKVLHLLAFGGMQLVLLRAHRFLRPEKSARYGVVLTVLVTSGLGALLEVYQATLPYRSAEFLDWVADTLGALLMGAFVWTRLRREERRAERQRGEGRGAEPRTEGSVP